MCTTLRCSRTTKLYRAICLFSFPTTENKPPTPTGRTDQIARFFGVGSQYSSVTLFRRRAACDCQSAMGLALLSTRYLPVRCPSHRPALPNQCLPLSGRSPHFGTRLSASRHMVLYARSQNRRRAQMAVVLYGCIARRCIDPYSHTDGLGFLCLLVLGQRR